MYQSFTMAALLLAIAALQAAPPSASPSVTPSVAPSVPDTERGMVERSNTFRAQHGLPALRPQADLSRAALAFAQYMARTDRYGHAADGQQPDERVLAAGYAHCMVAENIAWQYRSNGFSAEALTGSFVDGWINSPLHRRNLLATEAMDIGVAVARSESSARWYAVQLLARPAAMRMRFELSNLSAQPLRYEFDGREFPLPPGVTRWHESCSSKPIEIRATDGTEPLQLQPRAGQHYRIGMDPGQRKLQAQAQDGR